MAMPPFRRKGSAIQPLEDLRLLRARRGRHARRADGLCARDGLRARSRSPVEMRAVAGQAHDLMRLSELHRDDAVIEHHLAFGAEAIDFAGDLEGLGHRRLTYVN